MIINFTERVLKLRRLFYMCSVLPLCISFVDYIYLFLPYMYSFLTRLTIIESIKCELGCGRLAKYSCLLETLLSRRLGDKNYCRFSSVIIADSYAIQTYQPIPVAATSKAWVCGRSLPAIAGSNPVGMNICLL
jgi:hypothetical protein